MSARLTPETLAELRRLAEACPMPDNDPNILSEWYELENLTERNHPIAPIDAAFIVAASPDVVLGLLDAAENQDVLIGSVNHYKADRDALAEAVRAYGRTIDRWGLLIIAATRSEDITTPGGDGDWEVIESRLAEVPALLTERDALAANLAHMTEARDNARAEVERLTALLAEGRALHFGEYVEDEDRNRCFECGDDWPCPTSRALDGEGDRG